MHFHIFARHIATCNIHIAPASYLQIWTANGRGGVGVVSGRIELDTLYTISTCVTTPIGIRKQGKITTITTKLQFYTSRVFNTTCCPINFCSSITGNFVVFICCRKVFIITILNIPTIFCPLCGKCPCSRFFYGCWVKFYGSTIPFTKCRIFQNILLFTACCSNVVFSSIYNTAQSNFGRFACAAITWETIHRIQCFTTCGNAVWEVDERGFGAGGSGSWCFAPANKLVGHWYGAHARWVAWSIDFNASIILLRVNRSAAVVEYNRIFFAACGDVRSVSVRRIIFVVVASGDGCRAAFGRLACGGSVGNRK